MHEFIDISINPWHNSGPFYDVLQPQLVGNESQLKERVMLLEPRTPPNGPQARWYLRKTL